LHWARIQDVGVDLSKLTVSLADRMTGIVPDGFHVQAAEGMLWYSADKGRFPGQVGNYQVGRSGTYVRDNFNAHGQTDEDRIAGGAAQALDELQDYIDEATHDPWPGESAPPGAHAQVRDQILHLWYGGPDIDSGAVLACEPIPLADLQRLWNSRYQLGNLNGPGFYAA
jgi:hypothetical protein